MKVLGYALVLSLVFGQLACKSDPGASIEDAKTLLQGNWHAVEVEGNGGMKADQEGYLVHTSGMKMMSLLSIKGNEAKNISWQNGQDEPVISPSEIEIVDNKEIYFKSKYNGLTTYIQKARIIKISKDNITLETMSTYYTIRTTTYKRTNEDVVAKAQAVAQKNRQEREEMEKINRALIKGLEGKKLILVGENGCTATLSSKESEKLNVNLKLNGCPSEIISANNFDSCAVKNECQITNQPGFVLNLSEDKVILNKLNSENKVEKSYKFVSVQ